MIFENSQIAVKVFDVMREGDFSVLKSEPIFRTLRDFIKNGKPLDVHQFKEKLDPQIFRPLLQILMEGGQPASLEEAMDCLEALKKHSLKKQREKLNIEVLRLERQNEKEKIPDLLKKIQEITQELSAETQQN
jgi:replicative DNA helicase